MPEIVVINNYVDIPDESKVCNQTTDNIILFLGKMDYEPNVTAVNFFADEVFPELKSEKTDLQFIIIGARPSAEVLSLDQRDGISVKGYVESTEPYFQSASIVVAPMLSGSGVQNKIIQAMAYGCCVVTTNIGAEGLNLNGNELVILNGANEWISGLHELLLNKNLRLKYGKQARETIKSTLSKEIVFNQFCKMIENIDNL